MGRPGAASSANIPQELRAEPRWVCWRRVVRGGRATKMPVCAATGKAASSTDPATWATFEEARAACARMRLDGVGFVFGPDRAFTGLDLDHVIRGGVLDAEYRWVVEEAGTYTEVSPSGEGLHLIFRGSKPDWAGRSRRGSVEMYDHERFFTVTGDVFEGHGVLAADNGTIEKAYRTWIEPDGPAAQATLADVPPCGDGGGAVEACPDGGLSDDELLERACNSKNGGAIRALMAGDCSAQGGDHSAADMALCSHLAFWLGGDASRVDRVFRASGLMRPKWDSRRGSQTYGEQTVARAVEGCAEFYRPRKRRKAAGKSAARADTNACSTTSRPEAAGEASTDGGFDPDRPPSVERWHADDAGRLWVADADGELRHTVTSTAPWVPLDLVDVDSGRVRALVRVRVKGALVEQAVERDSLMNQNRIIAALAPLGANVSSANAKDVVRYLTDCERRFGDARPSARSASHLGWADGPLGAFMPYDAGSGGVRFDPAPDEAPKARPFMEPKGTLGEWVAGVAPARAASMAFRAVMAASFASPLVSVADVQTFIVYLWGRSRSGKTPTLKAAGSVWGDPTEGSDSYFRTFADTPKSIVRAAALLHSIPVIVDELQSKAAPGGQAGKRQLVEDLLYSLSLGHERGALNSDRTNMRTGSWRALTIATGEIPIVGDSTQQGAANRTLEINAEPFADPRDAQAMHRLVSRQHGTAGRAFVEALRRNERPFYEEQLAAVRGRVDAFAGGHPQADNAALLALADALAEFYVFSPGKGWDECLAGALGMAEWLLAHATGADGGDTDLKAVQRVQEWLVEADIHFDAHCENDRLERWGLREERPDRLGSMYYVFPSALERDLAAHGFDRQKTLRRMDDEGLLVRGSGRGFGKQKRVGSGSRVYCICIDGYALERFLARAHGVEPDEGVTTVTTGASDV